LPNDALRKHMLRMKAHLKRAKITQQIVTQYFFALLERSSKGR